MKISRGPSAGRDRNVTDCKVPSQYISNWEPKKKILLDGTIDKSGARHTAIELEIEENDVIALFNALVNNYRKEIKELSNKLTMSAQSIGDIQQRNSVFREAFSKIDSLIHHTDNAESKEQLIETIQIISAKFSGIYSYNELPKIDGLDWDAIKPFSRGLSYHLIND